LSKELLLINIHKYTQEENKNEESKKSVKNGTKKTGDTFKAAVAKTTGNSVKVSCEPFKTAGETFHACG
jgi:hypothetical protein